MKISERIIIEHIVFLKELININPSDLNRALYFKYLNELMELKGLQNSVKAAIYVEEKLREWANESE